MLISSLKSAGKSQELSLIHISEPTRRTPLYSSAASDVYKRTVVEERREQGLEVGYGFRKALRHADQFSQISGEKSRAVSYTHLRAHETDTSLFVGSVRCV